MKRVIDDTWRCYGEQVYIRLVTLHDCTDTYVGWLSDPEVNQFLETRWSKQSLDSIIKFVSTVNASETEYLFAIIHTETDSHIGNIKIGPINFRHFYADASYFIGEKASWGRGYATEAIRLSVQFGFDILKLHRIQAGLYESNKGSARALEKAGFVPDGVFSKQLRYNGEWQDHIFYRIINPSFKM